LEDIPASLVGIRLAISISIEPFILSIDCTTTAGSFLKDIPNIITDHKFSADIVIEVKSLSGCHECCL
jgi:hypothetical protein